MPNNFPSTIVRLLEGFAPVVAETKSALFVIVFVDKSNSNSSPQLSVPPPPVVPYSLPLNSVTPALGLPDSTDPVKLKKKFTVPFKAILKRVPCCNSEVSPAPPVVVEP